MQPTTRFPLIYRLLLGLGGVLLASFIMLISAPLLHAYGLAFGIPLLRDLTFPAAMAAIALLFLSVPLSWGLGCAGLILEWMGRRQDKRKRKFKRTSTSADRGRLPSINQGRSVQRLAESREARRESSDPEPRLRSSCIVHKEKSKVHNVGRLR